MLIAILAYCWIAIAGLREVIPGDSGALARFYDYHSHVHLGVLEQIRLGAMPYLEAQTQYGLGNLLLLYFATDIINFSNHGFYAGAMLVDVVCVVAFFVVLQQLLGLGWAIAASRGMGALAEPCRRSRSRRMGGSDALARGADPGVAARPRVVE